MSSVRVFSARHVELALPPEQALEAVRTAFIEYARGAWRMPAKLYLTNYPAGDFRAMPAIGAGHALLKWVTSFPGNPACGLPTVSGAVLVSDAQTGVLEAILDAGAVTARRTGAAAVLAAETLAREDSDSVSVIGAGVNGRATAQTFLARGRNVSLWDLDPTRARDVADELGATVAPSLAEALRADIVVTVTPAREPVVPNGALAPGQHVSLMGADGPGKSEISAAELVRGNVFCDDWGQASHSGDLARAVESGRITRAEVSELGEVLAGTAPGRRSRDDITLFDSTGLAIQDLAVAIACLERADALELPTLDLA